MGGKTSTSSSQVSIPPEVLARYNAVNANAEKVGQTPFQQYSSDPNAFVAPLNQQQIAGIQNINQSAGAAQPYYGAATRMTAAGAAPTNIGNVSGQDIGQYMNPYTQSVVNPAAQLLNQQQQAQMSAQTGQAMKQGAFGGDRSNLAAANLAGQQGLAFSNAINPLFSQGYTQALGAAQQQQGFQLGQEQQNLARMGQAGQQLAGIGTAAQGAGLQGAQAQLAAGQIGQQTEQAGKSALYNQFQQQQSYPFQTAQFLANIAMGTGALSGSTTTTQQPQSFFSDERVKEGVEDIGRTHDGQKIVKFRYKGEKGPKQIGLIAQDVEKHHPDAVGEYHGVKTVDYDKATKDAASMGGAVEPQHAGLGFAGGGLVSPEDWSKLAAAHQQMWAGNAKPITGGMPHGGKGLNFPAPGHVANLVVAKAPAQASKTGMQQMAGGLSDAAKGVKDVETVKKAWDKYNKPKVAHNKQAPHPLNLVHKAMANPSSQDRSLILKQANPWHNNRVPHPLQQHSKHLPNQTHAILIKTAQWMQQKNLLLETRPRQVQHHLPLLLLQPQHHLLLHQQVKAPKTFARPSKLMPPRRRRDKWTLLHNKLKQQPMM
jgi:hypothetical protein